MAQLLVTLVGDDRSGLVSALSVVVADHDGNWLESEMARLGGKFAGVALVELPEERVEEFTAAAQVMAELQVSVTPAGDDHAAPGTPLQLHLVGNDRPGIVREVTAVLARLDVGIEEFHTSHFPAPMADTVLFEAEASLRLPEGLDVEALRDALEDIAAELMVDLEFDEGEDTDVANA